MLPECQLFGTLGCHLCEVAEALLMPFVEHGLLVELVDIADREDWVEHIDPMGLWLGKRARDVLFLGVEASTLHHLRLHGVAHQ